MKGKVLNTFPKIHWATYIQSNGKHRGYLDGWWYGLPEYSVEAPTLAEVETALSTKLDEWKAQKEAA
ncbi:hypothetical protein BTE77_06515 [Ensifer adhaerens]|nr:hypothetical protein BTE77_06515 [Ensifer adhaerens]